MEVILIGGNVGGMIGGGMREGEDVWGDVWEGEWGVGEGEGIEWCDEVEEDGVVGEIGWVWGVVKECGNGKLGVKVLEIGNMGEEGFDEW